LKRTIPSLAFALALVACGDHERAPVAEITPRAANPVPTRGPVLGYIDEAHLGTPQDGGVLRRRLIGDPGTLNAVLQSSTTEQQVLACLSRNLLDFDSRLNLVPGLAQKYEISPDGRTFRFWLRPEAVWEDGTPVTSADAVFTIRRIHDPKVPSPVFKTVFEDLESVEALDARSFAVKFKNFYPYRAMAFVVPLLPERRYAGKDFLKAHENRAPLSNGPYRLASWKSQEALVLERNPRYWGERSHFDKVIFRILPDDTVAYRAVVSGELDETSIDTSGRERALSDPSARRCCRLVDFYNLDYNYIALNNRLPFFSDARVRRALTMLLDRGKIVRNIFRGSARIISGPWAPDSPAYDPTVAPLPFDREGAAALLDEAGWKDTDGDGIRDRGGKKFAFELLVSAGTTVGREIDETLAGELARVGIRATVRPMEWAAFIERIDAGDFEAASLASSATDPNPDPYPFWHSSQVPPAGLNDGFYRNPDADRMMEQARSEPDERRRLAIYHQLHRLLRDDAPAIFVTNASLKFFFSRRVRGLATSPLGLFGIWPGPLAWWEEGRGVHE